MPRLTEILMYRKPLKKFTNYKSLPIHRQVLPPALKDSVASKGERKKVAPCLQEMSQMLVCLKGSDYNQVLCSKEIQMFDKCQKEFMEARGIKQEAESKGMMSSTGRLNGRQLNKLLKQYPQPK